MQSTVSLCLVAKKIEENKTTEKEEVVLKFIIYSVVFTGKNNNNNKYNAYIENGPLFSSLVLYFIPEIMQICTIQYKDFFDSR